MADDYTDNTSTLGSLYPGGQATGIFEQGNDTDWFRISLTAGKFYTFELSSASTTSYYQQLVFFDSQGNYLSGGGNASGGIVTYTVKAPSTGTFYIGARNQDYSSGFTTLPYTLKAGDAVTDDIGDTRGVAQVLTLGEGTSATLEGGSDIDYFKVALQAGVTYTVTPAWNTGGTGSSHTGNLRLEDADGNYINAYSPYGNPSFTVTRTADYYIAVSNQSGPAMSYNITVAKAKDDYAASATGAGQLAVGGADVAGTLDVAGDADWYGTELTANQTYWFTLGPGASPGYTGSGTLKLIGADGAVLATTSGFIYDANSPVLLEYVPTASGKYYLEVSDTSFNTGKYAVRAVVGEQDDYGNTQAAAAAIAVGAAMQGKLAIPQDQDVFKLSVTAGKSYLVALTAQGVAANTELVLTGVPADYSGSFFLAEYAKAGVAEYRVLTASSTGDYYFTVNTSNGRGTGGYTLQVTEPGADDYAADASTTGVLAVGGQARGVLDYTGDSDAFKVTLQYGAKYAFQLRGAGSGEGTLQVGNTVQLQISGPDANSSPYLNYNLDGTYTFTTTKGGEYTIAVRPQGNYYGSNPVDLTGSYTVHAVALNDDTTAPTLLSHSPATGANPLDNITLRFSEAVMRGAYSSNETITLRDSLGVVLETYYRDDARITIHGDTLTIDPTVQLKPGSKYLLSVPGGTVVDLAGNKVAGNQLLAIETVATVATGTPGNDYLIGLGTGATLSGGAGVDTVIYGYDRGAYDVVRGASATKVTSKAWDNTAGSADMLDGVERLMFSNVSVALDIDGVAGQAYRLYRAAFDRAPDLAGIGYWIGQLDKGLPLAAMAQGFLNSGEFATLYGAAPADGLFVNKLYQNILHRAPDQGGVDYWLDVLAGGADRANVLVAFSEGTENQAAVLQVIGNGFEFTPYG